MSATIDYLARMVQQLEQANVLAAQSNALLQALLAEPRLRAPAGATTLPLVPTGLFPTSLALNPTPDRLSGVVQAAASGGATDIDYGTFNIVSLPLPVPAHGEYLLYIPTPPGFTIQLKRRLVGICDTYMADLVIADFEIDGVSVLQPTFPYVVSGPVTFEAAVDVLVNKGVEVLLVNDSPYEVVFTMAAEAMHLSNVFVKTYMVPALDYVYRQTKILAAAATAVVS